VLHGSAGLGPSLFSAAPRSAFRLPKRLREISGLAATSDGRLMGHDDEEAVIYELDVAAGQIVKRFSLGDPAMRGDFEGLAIGSREVFYLVTSDGLIHCFEEAEDRAFADFELFDTGLDGRGEVEGVAFDAVSERLVLACKTNYSAALQGAVALYAWSPLVPDQPARPWLTLPVYPLAQAVGARSFHPSALEIDPQTGRLVVVASLENAMVELDREGRVLAARSLGARHRQPEGAAILPDGALVIADEAAGGEPMLTCYDRAQP
jgi:hypothetical protein